MTSQTTPPTPPSHASSAVPTSADRGLNPVFVDRPTSIFPTMTALARAHDAVNLGQGFPDEDGPATLHAAAAEALNNGWNQYAPINGEPALRQAVAAANKRFYGLDLDPDAQVIVTAGATIGLASAFLAFCRPGDEAIVVEPFYECYGPQLQAAGATPRYVRLEAPDWRLDPDAIAAAVTERTKLIVLNTPHNPCGAVLSAEELDGIAKIAVAHDLIVVCDEVYEHIVFDGRKHIPLLARPGMAERCVRFGSAGKTFSLTGWRIGYASGAAHLIDAVLKAHQFLAYTCPSHLQVAVAHGLGLPDAYYDGLADGFEKRRDFLRDGLADLGLDVAPCAGAYFLSADIRAKGFDDDAAFCRQITIEAGVAAVPNSAFYRPAGAGDKAGGVAPAPRRYARFCFAKKFEVLEEALTRLERFFKDR